LIDEDTRSEVLRLASSGLSIREIADRLPISKSSAANIIQGASQKATSTAEDDEDAIRRPESAKREPPDASLNGLLDSDKKRILKLRAKKMEKEIELEIAKIEAKIESEISKVRMNGVSRFFIQLIRTLIAYHSSFNDENYYGQAVQTWKMLFEIFQDSGNDVMLHLAIQELCDELGVSTAEFSRNPEWHQEYGLNTHDLETTMQ
jgi:hypothetical protein